MHGFSDVTLKNWNGIDVGALRASDGAAPGAAAHGS